ncbi:uncharacterized protein PgNI_07862 [Pyricularia grisea]|uniref:Uncharacterized protein n=1 Tax=Pyricularia grisea TaxID=148305 RepID=A0A6P8B0C7_PYRGI|nr:uncharacterized protein PgNI_07862 [Pyricularia grisea]TLD08284.1 hypothetical protein PgNI_07862 [Pyricularia grisea]
MLAGHCVVIVTWAPGLTGNVNAGRVTGSVSRTFSCLRMDMLVGVGGGVPRAQPSDDPTQDLHVGDIVVGWPGDGRPAIATGNAVVRDGERRDQIRDLCNGAFCIEMEAAGGPL